MRARIGRVAAVMLAVLVAAPAVGADDALRERIERLERELQELKEHARRREAEEQRREAAAKTEKEETPGYQALLERVKLGGYGSIRYEGSSLADKKHTFTYRRFVLTTDANIAPRLRAYLELELERFRELELEKKWGPDEGGLAAEQTVEGTDESEIALEQAWLQYDITDWLKVRAGGVLVPLGRFNLNHDDNRWNLPRRSLVDRGVSVLPVPAAWNELGVGILGGVSVGSAQLDYQAYVVNGTSLDFEFEQIARGTRGSEPGELEIEADLRPATGTFGSDVKDAKAVTGRLALSPRLGHEMGASGYFGQYTPDFLGEENVWSIAADGLTTHGPFALEGQWVLTRFEGIGSVARRLARVAQDQEVELESPALNTVVEFELSGLARTKHGYWLEGRYSFWPSFLDASFLKWQFDNPQLVAVVRGEQVWLRDLLDEVAFTRGRLTAFEAGDRRVDRITAGLTYRPVPLVGLQLAYEFTKTNSGKSLAGVTNFLPARDDEDHAHTVLVGAAFGF